MNTPFSPNLIIPQDNWSFPETTEPFQALTYEPSLTSGNYVILGDVSNAIPIGNTLFDNIPALEYREVAPTKRLPPLNIPENKEEIFKRLDSLVARFTNNQLRIQETLPSSILQYLQLVGIREVSFSATPSNLNTSVNSFQIRPSDAAYI
ncbi:MAG: hypothetical protein KIG81_07990, partial [Thermoguttaceae bacterium]|nr:hypothetical protein [Thermoguttaceae bacterium]